MELPWRLFGGIVLFWLLVGVVPFVLLRDLHDAAEFANVFGFVNALFAALAFGGVIWAIRLQTKELELQRLEIEETRDELRRSADAQHRSQQMHFVAALLAARNHVAQGYAAAAQQDAGALQASRVAHHQHVVELEWLLDAINRLEGNPFPVPVPATLAAHQVQLLLQRTERQIQAAIGHRATNHARSLVVEFGQSLREIRRLLPDSPAANCSLTTAVDVAIQRIDAVNTADSIEEIAEAFSEVHGQLTTFSKAPVDASMAAI